MAPDNEDDTAETAKVDSEKSSSENNESAENSTPGKIDMEKSLDEVSNVIHDILNNERHDDTDEKIDKVISAAAKARSDVLGEEETQRSEKPPAPESQSSDATTSDPVVQSILHDDAESRDDSKRYTFDEFIDERILMSRDAFGKKEMKIKILEVSDEKAPTSWKLGDRVKVDKILVTIKHLEDQSIEEGEFDIKSIEAELVEKRHYTSTNRWVPTSDIKNGYVVSSRHTSLISDAVALDYITF